MIDLSDCRPGTLVECIDAAFCTDLSHGSVYTVECARHGTNAAGNPGWGVRLVEVEPPRGFSGFDRSRFRVVPEGRLAMFRAMLQPTKEIA